MYGWSGGFGDTPTAPTGYWTNPANPTQWLSQPDAAKLGSLCFGGPVVGRYAVGGNYQNSVLFCRSLNCNEGAMIYGGLALAIALMAPGASKFFAILPAGYGALNCMLGN